MMMMMMMMSTGDIDEECDMEGDRHLYEESFREQQKILSISFAEARTFSRFFQRTLGDLNFSTLSTSNERNQRKS